MTGIGKVVADSTGTVLRAATAAAARVRPAAKPLHPVGTQGRGTLVRFGSDPAWGVDWLDHAGEDPVLVRFSRSLGLPNPWPDVFGIAVRVESGAEPVDLLFSTTGSGRLGRFGLVPRRGPFTTYGTLLPYRAPSGPVLLQAELAPGEPWTIALAAATLTGPWRAFGRIRVDPPPSERDPELSFDAVLHAPPGLPFYPWVKRVREGSYAAARAARGARLD